MKAPWLFLFLTMLAACSSTDVAPTNQASEDILVTGFPHLPADARDVAERLASCHHFWGEAGGNDSEREKEIRDTLKVLRCESIEAETTAIRSKYAQDKVVQDALNQAEHL